MTAVDRPCPVVFALLLIRTQVALHAVAQGLQVAAVAVAMGVAFGFVVVS
jgi:hypothetical protein